MIKTANRYHLGGFIGVLLVIILLEAWLTTLLPIKNGAIYKALTDKDLQGTWQTIGAFSVIAFSLICENTIKVWIGHRFAIYLREHVTISIIKQNKILEEWNVSNPAARICDDVYFMFDQSIRNFIEIIISGLICITLVYDMRHNRMLLCGAIGFIIISLFVTKMFKKPLVTIQYIISDRVSEFRNSLFNNDWPDQQEMKFFNLKDKILVYIRWTAFYDLFSSSQNRFASIFPILLLIPTYFHGNLNLGELMTSVGQFNLLVINACIWIILFPQITSAQASYRRVKELLE